jgi:hypothetical protein
MATHKLPMLPETTTLWPALGLGPLHFRRVWRLIKQQPKRISRPQRRFRACETRLREVSFLDRDAKRLWEVGIGCEFVENGRNRLEGLYNLWNALLECDFEVDLAEKLRAFGAAAAGGG